MNATQKRTYVNHTTLRDALETLPAEDHAAIRQAYYKAAEGLAALVDALDQAKTTRDGRFRLLTQRRYAEDAKRELDRSRLGQEL